MRICVVSRRNLTRDPRARALVVSLLGAGHRVTVVCGGAAEPGFPDDAELVTIPSRVPQGRGAVGRMLRRLQPPKVRSQVFTRMLRRAVAASTPDVVYPVGFDDLDLVTTVDAPIVRRPEWQIPAAVAARDLVALAPGSARWGASPDGSSAPFHLPGDHRPPSHPEPGRHQGVQVAIAYRVTPTNPGRYLEAALRRSGADVTVLDGVLDWNRISAGTAALVIVESPYPALEVVGQNPGVPVLWWVHHGEHHLPTNLRLARRYGAHAVLLAHSWHLAHRFPLPVHRFPFAVAPEMFNDPKPWEDRTHEVAMVGAGVGGAGSRYDRRRRIIEDLEASLPGRTTFAYGVPPEEMLALYGDSRIVVNDGGTKHFPITMRVFEAIGAGALLLTEDLPGTEVLLRRHDHYAPLGDDVAGQVEDLLVSGSSAGVAAAAYRHVADHHTYDHRVDELLAIAAATDPTPVTAPPGGPHTALGALIDRDVEVQEVAVFGVTDPLGLDDRVIREPDPDRLRPRSFDAVAFGPGATGALAQAVASARGYVYATEPHIAAVTDILAQVAPDADVTISAGLLRADLGGIGYRMRRSDHPLAS